MMIHKSHLPIVIGCSITLLVLILVVGSFALAQEGGGQGPMISLGQANPEALASPVPGGPGYVSLSAAAFHPRASNTQFQYRSQSLTCMTLPCDFGAAIPLPNDATITKFVVYYYNYDSQGVYLIASLMKGPFDSENGIVIAQVTGADTGNNYYTFGLDDTIDTPLVDLQSYSYYIDLQILNYPSGNVRLAGVRVDFSYPTMLPAINR